MGTPHARPRPLSSSHFLRHYLEMVASMIAGMAAYGMLFRGQILSRSYADEALMGLFMSVPMVAWMLYRGHTWRQSAEMVAAMLLPAAVVFGLAAGQPAVSDRALMLSTHAAMLLGMLALMLVRRADYAHAGACVPDDSSALIRVARPDA